VTPEMAEALGIKGVDKMTPAELIHAILLAPVDLLWNGGIGTYVKASTEDHLSIGDRANDAIRVDGKQLRVKVVGEGGNLGLSQLGRIEAAFCGVRVNTDAIDNSAGVDTSDHEVNIKILLGDVIRVGALKADKRDKLLESMTDDVGNLVLKDNYDQTLALTLSQASAAADLDSHERFMQRLEAKGKLVRRVEGLPINSEIAALRTAKLGMTRPELAKLIAYAKIDLFDALVASKAPDDPAFAEPLKKYFPNEVWKYEAQMQTHRLRREIVATHLANDLVNRCGPSFIDRVRDISRADPVVIALSFEAARRIFGLEAFFNRINALDNKVSAAAQTALHQRISSALRRAINYLARNAGFDRDAPPSVDDVVALYKPSVDAQRADLWGDLSEVERARATARQQAFVDLGAQEDLAREGALLSPLTGALDVADLARTSKWPVHPASLLHCMVGAEFGLDALRDSAGSLTLEQHWDRLVVRRAAEGFGEIQLRLAEAAAKAIGTPPKDADAAWIANAVKEWVTAIGPQALREKASFAELAEQGPWTFAKLMLMSAEANALAAAVR